MLIIWCAASASVSAPPCPRPAGTHSCRPCTPGRGPGCRAAGRCREPLVRSRRGQRVRRWRRPWWSVLPRAWPCTAGASGGAFAAAQLQMFVEVGGAMHPAGSVEAGSRVEGVPAGPATAAYPRQVVCGHRGRVHDLPGSSGLRGGSRLVYTCARIACRRRNRS